MNRINLLQKRNVSPVDMFKQQKILFAAKGKRLVKATTTIRSQKTAFRKLKQLLAGIKNIKKPELAIGQLDSFIENIKKSPLSSNNKQKIIDEVEKAKRSFQQKVGSTPKSQPKPTSNAQPPKVVQPKVVQPRVEQPKPKVKPQEQPKVKPQEQPKVKPQEQAQKQPKSKPKSKPKSPQQKEAKSNVTPTNEQTPSKWQSFKSWLNPATHMRNHPFQTFILGGLGGYFFNNYLNQVNQNANSDQEETVYSPQGNKQLNSGISNNSNDYAEFDYDDLFNPDLKDNEEIIIEI